MKYLIKGKTVTGEVFRPSDWANRLCSVFSHYRPNFNLTANPKGLGYSKYITPTVVDDIKCVLVDSELGNLEPLALEFVLNFAKDNYLKIIENYGEINNNMITTRFLPTDEYQWYADWLKDQDEETIRMFFGLQVSEMFLDQLVHSFIVDSDNNHFLIAERNGVWVGTVHIAIISSDEVEFGIIVDRGSRKQGIADQLMRAAIRWARERNYSHLYMHCLTWNKAIRHLCDKHGLEVKNFTSGTEVESRVKLPARPFTNSNDPNYNKVARNLYRLILQDHDEIFTKPVDTTSTQ